MVRQEKQLSINPIFKKGRREVKSDKKVTDTKLTDINTYI